MGFRVRMLNLSVLQGDLAGCCVIAAGQWIHICGGRQNFSVGFPTLKKRLQQSAGKQHGKLWKTWLSGKDPIGQSSISLPKKRGRGHGAELCKCLHGEEVLLSSGSRHASSWELGEQSSQIGFTLCHWPFQQAQLNPVPGSVLPAHPRCPAAEQPFGPRQLHPQLHPVLGPDGTVSITRMGCF